jgi:hypothetical protein
MPEPIDTAGYFSHTEKSAVGVSHVLPPSGSDVTPMDPMDHARQAWDFILTYVRAVDLSHSRSYHVSNGHCYPNVPGIPSLPEGVTVVPLEAYNEQGHAQDFEGMV